jgi:hypothetical protein
MEEDDVTGACGHMGEVRKACRIFVGKPAGRRELGRTAADAEEFGPRFVFQWLRYN